jgi:tRNA pseudouridine32 synthase/23S rRNA pseudouridine746 synthase
MIPARKGKPALTEWRVVAETGGRALVEFRPVTGRTHQLRVHSASGIGIPLLGDPVYGDGKGAWRTLLHAVALELVREGKPPVVASAPWPAEFAALGFAENG